MPILGGGGLGWATLASRPVRLPAWSEAADTGERHRHDGEVPIGSSRSGIAAGAAIEAPPAIVDSVAPAIGAPIADAEVSVIFPGYLLPDDSREEAANEGG
jgi:hypothetical protein